jgi:hypothetical protein
VTRTYIVLEAERLLEPGTLDTVLVDEHTFNTESDPRLYFRPGYSNHRRCGAVEMTSEADDLGTLPVCFVEDCNIGPSANE